MKRYIHDFISLKNFLTEARTPVLSVGVTAFSRVGATPSPNYQIFCLESTSDIDIIRSDYLVECLADIDPIYYQSHKKKTESIVEHPFLNNKAVDQKNGLILVYKYTDEIHRITKGLGLTVASRIPSSGELLENKIFFRQLIKDIDIDSYKTYSLTCNDLDYSELTSLLGRSFVLQYYKSSGGRGTFFVSNKQNFENAKYEIIKLHEESGQAKDNDCLVAAELVNGISASITAVATKWGTFSGNLQRQLIDIKESLNREEIINNGVFCGHEWGNNLFTEEMNAKAIELTQKFGEHIYDNYSYRGFFGLDLIIDEKNNCVYPIECNPRLTGVLPTLDLINDNNQIPTFIDLHMLEFISDTEEVTVNYKEIQQDLSRKIQGSHLHILSGEKPGGYSLNLESGVYRLEDSLVRIRPGYNFSHLKSDDEFLVVEGRTEIHPVAEKSRVCRIISRSPISRNDNQLNDFGRKIVISTKDHIIYHEKV